MSLLRVHPGDPSRKSRSLEIGPLGGAALAGLLLGCGASIVLGLAGAPSVVSDAVHAADRRAIRETAQRGAESFASVGRRALALGNRLLADELFLARVGAILEIQPPDRFPGDPRDAAPATPAAMEAEAADLARRTRLFELFRRRLAGLPAHLPAGFDPVFVPSRAPVEPSSSVPIELFGWHASDVMRRDEFCSGLTLASPAGTPVTAPAAGVVAFSGPVSRRADAAWRRLGTIVVLSHDARTRTVYGHLSPALVKKGQRVSRGTPIGRVGTSGFTVTPRLHYEVHRLVNDRWVPRDPRIFVLDVDWIGAAGFRAGPTPPELPDLPVATR
ncbi:MAG: M23 family metallopeptidase [Thermoanaerobaculia bacterium]|nr:M23 family metallopeptidase [Thermoanaerobaculia bacterium]